MGVRPSVSQKIFDKGLQRGEGRTPYNAPLPKEERPCYSLISQHFIYEFKYKNGTFFFFFSFSLSTLFSPLILPLHFFSRFFLRGLF